MFKGAKNKKDYSGQTATELAIFGALLVFVLGILINYALNQNYSQELPLRAFRRAMQFAPGSNLAASVTIIEDKDIPYVSGPLVIADRTGFISGASVNKKIIK
jgi:hypothetical protein